MWSRIRVTILVFVLGRLGGAAAWGNVVKRWCLSLHCVFNTYFINSADAFIQSDTRSRSDHLRNNWGWGLKALLEHPAVTPPCEAYDSNWWPTDHRHTGLTRWTPPQHCAMWGGSLHLTRQLFFLLFIFLKTPCSRSGNVLFLPFSLVGEAGILGSALCRPESLETGVTLVLKPCGHLPAASPRGRSPSERLMLTISCLETAEVPGQAAGPSVWKCEFFYFKDFL